MKVIFRTCCCSVCHYTLASESQKTNVVVHEESMFRDEDQQSLVPCPNVGKRFKLPLFEAEEIQGGGGEQDGGGPGLPGMGPGMGAGQYPA